MSEAFCFASNHIVAAAFEKPLLNIFNEVPRNAFPNFFCLFLYNKIPAAIKTVAPTKVTNL